MNIPHFQVIQITAFTVKWVVVVQKNLEWEEEEDKVAWDKSENVKFLAKNQASAVNLISNINTMLHQIQKNIIGWV